jgi:putative endonuclease
MDGNKRTVGAKKEQLAADYLESLGWTILERNFFCRQGEIDLIALSPEKTLVFVEVKYRSNTKNGFPEEAVGTKKQIKIQKAAKYYLFCRGYQEDISCRFDVIAILGEKIKLYKNAFF